VKSPKKFKIFTADFESVIVNEKHYVSLYTLVGETGLVASGSYKDYEFSNEIEYIQKNYTILEKFIFEALKLSEENLKIDIFIFFHNLSRFDNSFILDYICNHSPVSLEVKILMRDNFIYEIEILNKIINSKIIFRDSLLLLPNSLEELATLFDTEKKLPFSLPSTLDQLESTNFDEYLNYCQNDSEILFKILKKFQVFIYNKFEINFVGYRTISSLAFQIFRQTYYDAIKVPIYKLNRDQDAFIRLSYYGGFGEVYKQYLKKGFLYDINSLYPYVMKNNDFPIGMPKILISIGPYFNIDNFFGFLEVEVIAPENLNRPFLVHKQGELLLAPVGKWEGVYFSEEIKYALTLGYTFKYLRGVQFDKGPVFESFVDAIYNLRVEYSKKASVKSYFKDSFKQCVREVWYVKR